MVLKTAGRQPFLLVTISILLLLFSPGASAQKLRLNAYDKYEKKWRMETVAESLKSAEDTKMDIAFASADTSLFLQLSGSGIGCNTVGIDNPVIFLFDDDSSVTATSQTMQALDYNKLPLTYRHQYVLYANALEGLTRHRLKAVRKYSLGGFDDIYIEDKDAARLRELSRFFISALNKKKLLPPTQPVTVKAAVIPPAFPGGTDVLLQFLNRNVKSVTALQAGEKKTISVEFLVAADGSVNDILVSPSGDVSLDKEALRILQRMPKWKPAIADGKPIAYKITQPVIFYPADGALHIQF